MARTPFGIVTKRGRFVGQKILNQYATKAESRKLADAFAESYATQNLLQPLYNPEQLAKLLEINTYHYRAVKTKARDTAGLGWSLQPVQPEQGEADDEAADVTALRTFLEGLTPALPMILDRGMTDYEAVGWGCLELIREDYATDGPYSDMEHIPAHTIRLHKDGIRIVQMRGNRKRWFKHAGAQHDVHADDGRVFPLGALEARLRATEIMFWTNYTPRSDFYGLPDVMPALGAIQGDIARRDYNIAFFDNFGVPAYAVFLTGEFDPGDEITEGSDKGRTELEVAIEQHFAELAKNPHSTLILSIPGKDVKVEFQPLATDVKEASFRLYRADNRDEILAAHGVPPYRAGISETGSLGGSTAKEATEIYKRSVIEPRQSIIEHMFNAIIVRDAFGVMTHVFRLDQIDTTDESHDMSIVKSLFDMGAIDHMEVRGIFAKRFGLDPERAPLPKPGTSTLLDDVPAEVFESVAASAFERAVKFREERESEASGADRALRMVQGGSLPRARVAEGG